MTSLKTEVKVLKASKQIIKLYKFDCWPQRLQLCLRQSSLASFMLLLVSSLTFHSKLSFLYILIGTFAFLPSPPSPSTLLSEWPARALWSVCCSHWQAGAGCCYPYGAPLVGLWSDAAAVNGRSQWIIAGRPCKSGRTSRVGVPWAEQHRDYSARGPRREPHGREWMRTWT